MRANTTSIGSTAEMLARKYLESSGYSILETNWRFKRLEVDIIARNSSAIIFVEVKFRSSGDIAEPELSVGKKKQAFLISAAHHYLTIHDVELEARFDIISMTGPLPDPQIRHLESAFFPIAK